MAAKAKTCESCADHWKNQNLPVKKLVRIGSTQNRKLFVWACPYCDGERAIALKKRD
jgi:hypothetical protein